MKYLGKILGFLIIFFSLLFLPQAVFADQTASLLPVSDGNYLQWTPKSGTTHFTQVDETTCNGTTDYNSTTTVGNRDSYGTSLSSIPDGSTITQLDITPCASRVSSGGANSTMNVFYRLNGIDSSDAGNYSLTGTTPTVLSATTFSGLSTNKSSTTILETGAVLSAGTKGARLSQISVKITYTPLSTPSGLTAAASSSAVVLNWTDNSSNEDGFRIERSNGGAFVEIATVGANVHTYLDSPVTEGTYTYRVRAYNSGGNSGYTGNASASVISAPTNFSAVATNSANVTLSWTDTSTIEAGFKIEIATGAGQFVQIKTVGTNVTSYTDTNRSPNDYHYRVRAFLSTSNSDYSNSGDATVLIAPTNLSATIATGSSDVNLSWNDNSSNEDGFRIERADNGGGFVEINTVGSNVTTYTDPALATGSYIYRVRGYKATNTSSYTNTSGVSIP
jgi:hypothetical protein